MGRLADGVCSTRGKSLTRGNVRDKLDFRHNYAWTYMGDIQTASYRQRVLSTKNAWGTSLPFSKLTTGLNLLYSSPNLALLCSGEESPGGSNLRKSVHARRIGMYSTVAYTGGLAQARAPSSPQFFRIGPRSGLRREWRGLGWIAAKSCRARSPEEGRGPWQEHSKLEDVRKQSLAGSTDMESASLVQWPDWISHQWVRVYFGIRHVNR